MNARGVDEGTPEPIRAVRPLGDAELPPKSEQDQARGPARKVISSMFRNPSSSRRSGRRTPTTRIAHGCGQDRAAIRLYTPDREISVRLLISWFATDPVSP